MQWLIIGDTIGVDTAFGSAALVSYEYSIVWAWSILLCEPLCILLWQVILWLLQLPLPNFSDLSAQYPGYKHYGGQYRNQDVYGAIGQSAVDVAAQRQDSSGLRLSLALNRLSGLHRLGMDTLTISKHDTDSVRGNDNLQYIYRTRAFGPLLAMKYHSPELIYRTPSTTIESIRNKLRGRQGIVRIVTFHNEHKSFDTRISLWDCERFYQARDYLLMHHIVSVEFWQLPG